MKLEERTFGTPCTGKLLILSILRKIGDCERSMLGVVSYELTCSQSPRRSAAKTVQHSQVNLHSPSKPPTSQAIHPPTDGICYFLKYASALKTK